MKVLKIPSGMSHFESIETNIYFKRCLHWLRDTNNPIYLDIKDLPLEYLGCGSYADAFKIGKYCFKLTNDKDDAIMSHVVKRKDLKHIVFVHEVVGMGDFEVYCIISDYLDPIDYNKDFRPETVSCIGSIIARAIKGFYTYSELKKDIKGYRIPLKIYSQFLELYKELERFEFESIDLHHDNIRLGNDGLIKMVDLGHRTSSKVIEIKKIY